MTSFGRELVLFLQRLAPLAFCAVVFIIGLLMWERTQPKEGPIA